MQRFSITHNDVEREYYVYLPSQGSGQSKPALIFLHGYGGTATGTEAETTYGLNRYAEQHGFVAIYPQGTWFEHTPADGDNYIVTSWNDLAGNQDQGPQGPLCSADAPKYPCPAECGDCGKCGWTSCHDDLGFLTRLIEHSIDRHHLDESRIYLSGFSNGAMMAQQLACSLSNRFAAVALVGGRLERGFDCSPKNSVPLLQLNGGMDEVVPYHGALPDSHFFYTSAEQVHQHWSQANACHSEDQSFVDPAMTRAGVTCNARCGNQNNESINCLWHKGSHVWPGVPANHGSGGYCVTKDQQAHMPNQTLCTTPQSSHTVWGSQFIFEFFGRHDRG